MVGNHLHEKDPNAQKGTHKKTQGKTESNQRKEVLGHPGFLKATSTNFIFLLPLVGSNLLW